MRLSGKNLLILGLGMTLVGTILTIGTYSLAMDDSTKTGKSSTYVVFPGLIVFGLINAANGGRLVFQQQRTRRKIRGVVSQILIDIQDPRMNIRLSATQNLEVLTREECSRVERTQAFFVTLTDTDKEVRGEAITSLWSIVRADQMNGIALMKDIHKKAVGASVTPSDDKSTRIHDLRNYLSELLGDLSKFRQWISTGTF